MTPDRWQTIERLYHATLERSPSERDGFLAGACQGDEALRTEVESLIAHGLDAPAVLDAEPSRELRAALTRRFDEQPGVPGRYLGRMFGPYKLQAVLAAGGMGEVYRAADTRLNRTVAIKILLHDPERHELTREAEIVSSLNHPHICTIHDIGSEDGVDYIVMEYLEGETLQQRLTRGALPLGKAIEYCTQIVDALDKSHRRGIVHRDIKPANVMLTAVGVKVLDFGIATRMGGSDALPVMATPPYASPEQLVGHPVDARTDIFSFGAVAYEMITGRRAFQGDTPAALVASVRRDEPLPLRDHVPAVPEPLARTLSRCLAKAPDERWQTANDLLFELRSLATATMDPAVADRPIRTRTWTERAVWAVALVTALILYAFARTDPAQVAESPAPDLRFDLWPERDTSYASSFDVPFALAPDGRSLAYVAVGRDAIKRLWIRTLGATARGAVEIAGTEDANTPFWSPDGAWVGFFSRHRLLKVRVSDRRVHTIATHVSTMAGATWNSDGVILFTGGPGGLSRVSAEGGAVVPVTTGEGSHFWPQFIGDGHRFIYAAAIPGEIRLGSLTGQPSRVLMKVALNPSSLVYTRGYLFFGRDSKLFARAFDEATLEFVGEPIELLTGIPVTQLGRMPFSVSAAGPLAVWQYPGGSPATLRWFTEKGASAPVVETPARYVGVALAPDARRLALSRRRVNGGADVWVRDLVGSTETQLTFDGLAFAPRWSADGARLVFTSTTKVPPRLLIKSLQRPTGDVELGGSRLPAFASSWSGDGARIVSVRIDPATRDDLYVDYLQDGRAERLPMNTAANEYQAVVSPDDRWLAYVTDESGRDEVWVASFPSGQVKRQVSIGGGTSPQWTDRGRELAYLSQRKWLTIRSFAGTDSDVALGTPRELFDAATFVETTPLVTPTANAYAAAVDGRRFLAAVRANDPAVPPIQLIVNWRTLLRDR
jgi:eukaryotic-like serine/threonine-protein kinase